VFGAPLPRRHARAVARVVDERERAAIGVQVGNGEFSASLRYPARPCDRSRQRRGEADPDHGAGRERQASS
jgi:hypothetical protein